MKIKYLTFTIVFFLSFFVMKEAFCSDYIVEKQGNIVNYVSKQDPVRYAENIVLNKTDKEKKELLNYVMNNPEKVLPITYMALADYIYENDNKKEALFWYYVGSLRSYEDLNVCTEKSAWAQVGYYPMLAPKTAEYSGTLSDDERNQLTEKALKWDEAHPDRVNPKWACYHGFYDGDVTTKPIAEYLKLQKEFREKVRSSFKN